MEESNSNKSSQVLKQDDPVNHPTHYNQGGVECIVAIEAALGPQGFIDYLRGQAMKYNWRLGLKGNPTQDGQKGQWYQNLLVKKLQELSTPVNLSVAQTDKVKEPSYVTGIPANNPPHTFSMHRCGYCRGFGCGLCRPAQL